MSNSPQSQHHDTGPGLPTAMVHKNILDTAEARPDASLEELADAVSGATPGLVERVLKNYGDPAEKFEAEPDRTATPEHHESPPAPQSDTPAEVPDDDRSLDQFSEPQREILRAIADHPEATQRELADALGVSCATINRRVNAIETFRWEERRAFVEGLFGDAAAAGAGSDPADERLSALSGRLDALERRLDEESSGPQFGDASLAHKVLLACLESDRISEAEELKIVGELVGTGSD